MNFFLLVKNREKRGRKKKELELLSVHSTMSDDFQDLVHHLLKEKEVRKNANSQQDQKSSSVSPSSAFVSSSSIQSFSEQIEKEKQPIDSLAPKPISTGEYELSRVIPDVKMLFESITKKNNQVIQKRQTVSASSSSSLTSSQHIISPTSESLRYELIRRTNEIDDQKRQDFLSRCVEVKRKQTNKKRKLSHNPEEDDVEVDGGDDEGDLPISPGAEVSFQNEDGFKLNLEKLAPLFSDIQTDPEQMKKWKESTRATMSHLRKERRKMYETVGHNQNQIFSLSPSSSLSTSGSLSSLSSFTKPPLWSDQITRSFQ